MEGCSGLVLTKRGLWVCCCSGKERRREPAVVAAPILLAGKGEENGGTAWRKNVGSEMVGGVLGSLVGSPVSGLMLRGGEIIRGSLALF